MHSFITINSTPKQDNKMMPSHLKEKMNSLTKQERKYFMAMWPKSGVPFISSKPGVGKTAMIREIGSKMGFSYTPLYLAMMDDTDVGLFPYLGDTTEGVKCIDYAVPRWALEANTRPTILHFDELNRASLSVRNAALQILLEREIGDRFKFNDNVLMIASGNLGEEDGTDVEEFDAALNNRLIHFHHSLGTEDWIEAFAKENCHELITSYIQAYPDRLYQNPTENCRAFPTPRTWTFLSNWIVLNFGKDATIRDFLPDLQDNAFSYVGNGATRFIQFAQDRLRININDILNRFDEVEGEFKKYKRDLNSELVSSLKSISIKTLTDTQIKNVIKFLGKLQEDELMGYLMTALDKESDFDDEKVIKFFKHFEFYLNKANSIMDEMPKSAITK